MGAIHTLDYAVYDATLIAKTDRAILVEVADRQVWVPRSQILYDSIIDEDSEIGAQGELVITKWLAERLW